MFFSRHECASYGAAALAPEHILLGLLREDRALTQKLTGVTLDIESIRAEVAASTPPDAKPNSPIGSPLTGATKRAVLKAAEVAGLLGHSHIGMEHLVLGLLADPASLATRILNARNVTFEGYRAHLQSSDTPPA